MGLIASDLGAGYCVCGWVSLVVCIWLVVTCLGIYFVDFWMDVGLFDLFVCGMWVALLFLCWVLIGVL